MNLRIFWFQSGDKRTVGAKNWGQCCRPAKRDRRTGSQLGKNHPYRSQRLIILHSLCLFIFTMIHRSTDHSGPWTDNWGAKGDGRSEVRRWPDYHGGTFTFSQSRTITILLADIVIVDFTVDSSGETGDCVNKQPGHHHQLRHMDSHLHHGWTFSLTFLQKYTYTTG